MKKLRIYSIGMACMIGGAWLLMSSDSESEREPAKRTQAATKPAGMTVAPRRSADGSSATATAKISVPKPDRTAPSLKVERPSEERVYENPADDPDSWSDFQAAIYAYKATVLGPRIKECWHTVTGFGEIVASHDYNIVDGIARPLMVTLVEGGEPVPSIQIAKADKSLSEADLQSALACLRSAAAETEFDFVGFNGETDLNDEFGGFWAWDTPALLEASAR